MIGVAGAVLADAAAFESAWYYALLIFAVLMVTAFGLVLALQALRPMWRAGDKAMATTIGAVCGITMLLFASMLAQVVVALLPNALAGLH